VSPNQGKVFQGCAVLELQSKRDRAYLSEWYFSFSFRSCVSGEAKSDIIFAKSHRRYLTQVSFRLEFVAICLIQNRRTPLRSANRTSSTTSTDWNKLLVNLMRSSPLRVSTHSSRHNTWPLQAAIRQPKLRQALERCKRVRLGETGGSARRLLPHGSWR